MKVTDAATGREFFSKRRRRIDHDRSPRELTFSCYRGFPFLAGDRTRQWLVEAIDTQRRQWPIDLWAWVIMPEHVHLLVSPREPGVQVGRVVGRIKEVVARRSIAWLEQHSNEWIRRITVHEGDRTRRRFWQPGGGYDRNIQEISTLHSMIEYIHANPVRRGLVERAVDWRWSSAGWYSGIRPAVLEMDQTLPAS